MARVIYSPLISSMSGKLADAVMSRWKGINYVRERVIPSNPQSALQTAQREALANTLTLWQSIKTWAKDVWNTYAEGYAMSGYNRYMEDNILHTKAESAGHITPYNADYIKISGEACAAGGAGEIDCTWDNDTGANPLDFMYFYYRKTEALGETYVWESGGSAMASEETHTIAGLDTGEEYEVGFFASLEGPGTAQQSFNECLNAG